jgi:hypothetical protein
MEGVTRLGSRRRVAVIRGEATAPPVCRSGDRTLPHQRGSIIA